MIYVVMPVGSYHGWGICGKYTVKELSKITDVKLLTDDFDSDIIGDEFDYRLLKSKLVSEDESTAVMKHDIQKNINYPVLQGILGNTMQPRCPNFKGSMNVGYVFFEDNILPESCIENGKQYFDTIVTGSAWCEEILRNYGLKNIKTVIQGIDATIFNPFFSEKEYLLDKFVIFSGGKFEFRKGQDLVIQAYKVLQDKYKDVMLVNSWYNQWEFSFNTMAASRYINFVPAPGNYLDVTNRLLHDNSIDIGRVITLPPYPNIMMSRIYKNSDIGLFPNRCEGGTNLVLMEYMACGKPVIASYNSGHKDILSDINSIKVSTMHQVTFSNNNEVVALWDEPDIDEIIEKLEWAYHNRNTLKEIGKEAGKDLSKLTWTTTARGFYDILKQT